MCCRPCRGTLDRTLLQSCPPGRPQPRPQVCLDAACSRVHVYICLKWQCVCSWQKPPGCLLIEHRVAFQVVCNLHQPESSWPLCPACMRQSSVSTSFPPCITCTLQFSMSETPLPVALRAGAAASMQACERPQRGADRRALAARRGAGPGRGRKRGRSQTHPPAKVLRVHG